MPSPPARPMWRSAGARLSRGSGCGGRSSGARSVRTGGSGISLPRIAVERWRWDCRWRDREGCGSRSGKHWICQNPEAISSGFCPASRGWMLPVYRAQDDSDAVPSEWAGTVPRGTSWCHFRWRARCARVPENIAELFLLALTAGRSTCASFLLSSTPIWSNGLVPRIVASTNTRCS